LRIDPEELRRHYASLSDEALGALDRDELVSMAQKLYDEEVARRELTAEPDESAAPADPPGGVEEAEGELDGELDIDDGPTPDWLEDAACACSFGVHYGTPYAENAANARAALRAAGIPCYITMQREDPPSANPPPRQFYNVMVPGALSLQATSVLDRDIFNAEHEADWRTHLEALSDEELRAQNPEIFCAGLLDRAARLKRAYRDEIARRGLK
jgi:hypothetical protein